MIQKIVLMSLILNKYSEGKERQTLSNEIKYNDLGEHTIVTDSNVFPYVVAILKMTTFLSSGTLIDENWVITAADSLYFLREASRMIRVRLGSINYKKGGLLLPIKYYEIHPLFDDNKPIYDVALLRLPNPVRYTPTLRAIRLQKEHKEADATHFVIPSWPSPIINYDESDQIKSMELIKRQRILSVTHLHPSDPEDCFEELNGIGINSTDSVMCLDTEVMTHPCLRDAGAPVVLNDVLWGIVSSWKPPDCENELAGPSFVTLVSSPYISTWIHDTISHGHIGK